MSSFVNSNKTHFFFVFFARFLFKTNANFINCFVKVFHCYFLALVAYCESWRRAFWRILPSVAAAFGAVAALYLSGVAFSVYSRYALLMLVSSTVAMSLLTESLPTFRKRAALPLLAALTMLPLVFSSGAGSAGSCSLGMTFFGGYAGCALLSGFLAAAPRSVVQTERKESL